MKTKEGYAEYLKSDHWQALRVQVIERDGGKCTRCPSREQLQAHHLLYRDRWEDAKISDLVTLCRPCHEKEHGIKPSEPPAEVGRDYLSQIFTWDQLLRARRYGFVTVAQFETLRPRFEPADSKASQAREKKLAEDRNLIKQIRKRRRLWRRKTRSGRWSC